MFSRSHHNHIAKILNKIDHHSLRDLDVGFGGGTAISLMLDEYRLSTDIDFLCSNPSGYKELRQIFRDDTQRAGFLGPGVVEVREFRSDANAIRGLISVDDSKPIKIELVREARIDLDAFESLLGPVTNVPVLTRADLFAEKLLANEDRGLDPAFHSRDIIDIALMIKRWGPIPERSWAKVDQAYGVNDSFKRRLQKTKDALADPHYLAYCVERLDIDPTLSGEILRTLGVEPAPYDPDVFSPYLGSTTKKDK